MAKFCGRCGAKLDGESGKCPNCDIVTQTQQPPVEAPKQTQPEQLIQLDDVFQQPTVSSNGATQNKPTNQESEKPVKRTAQKPSKPDKKASAKEKKKGVVLPMIAIVLCVVLLLSVIAGVLVYCNIINIPILEKLFVALGWIEDDSAAVSYDVPTVDAEEYYSENATIVQQIDINQSTNVSTEAQTHQSLTERGFQQYSITTNYSMDGEYADATDISSTSTSKHPMYQTYYVSANGDVWIVMSIDGEIMASPVSYNAQLTGGVEVAVSESGTVTSYDSVTNSFYKTVPNETTLKVIVVDYLDAAMLDRLTVEEIENYVS